MTSQFALHRLAAGLDLGAQASQCASMRAGIEVVGGFLQGAGRKARGQIQEAVLHRTVIRHQYDEGAGWIEPDEFDVFQVHVCLSGEHDACSPGNSGQQRRGLGQGAFECVARCGGTHLGLDPLLLLAPDIADLQHGIDKEAQAHFRRKSAGGCVRREDQARMLQIRHDIADRGRRQRHGQDACEVAGSYRFARREVALHDLSKDLACALV